MKKIGVIGAMDVEVRTLHNAMTSVRVNARAGIEFCEGVLAGAEAVVARCGIGKVNAAVCAQILIDSFNVSAVINTGIAGAISPKLRPLDIVLSADAVYHDFDVTDFGYPPLAIPGMNSVFKADERLILAAENAASQLNPRPAIHKGRIATGDIFVASGEAKARIQRLCAPLCVEMEGAAIAHVCAVNGVPFVIIRSISDMADDTGGSDYVFNEQSAAETSASLVIAMCAGVGGRE
ncbi:MAG: 5'-methylthioadenosine/adenosylhomocysteine nucleosidase [Treponemataceae bacterium]|nr:MAG: 5'-methylthioadenosine/adenosylhomocysteine nucleosidase [Treponemataceae bacterium]